MTMFAAVTGTTAAVITAATTTTVTTASIKSKNMFHLYRRSSSAATSSSTARGIVTIQLPSSTCTVSSQQRSAIPVPLPVVRSLMTSSSSWLRQTPKTRHYSLYQDSSCSSTTTGSSSAMADRRNKRNAGGIGIGNGTGTGTDTTTRSFGIGTNTNSNTNMADEYSATATMEEMSDGDTCTIPHFTLECGVILSNAQIRYRTYGVPPQTTKETSNVIVICHALTGNASIDTWWSTLLGPHKAFDTERYHIICCNILGSCYGSTSPISINPNTHQPYGIDFPNITVQDTVRIQLQCLQQQLGFQSIQCVIGGSFGGMQTLEYAIQGNQIAKPASVQENTPSTSNTPYIKSIIPIACNAQHSAWQIAISEIQRQMIYQDVQWSTHQQYHLATDGLQLARQMAMISYRTAMGYSNKFSRRTASPTTTTTTSEDGSSSNDKLMNNTATTAPPVTTVPQWEVSNYLKYQGEKFVRQRQFDPITYVKLTQQMDTHDICRNRIEEDHTATAANTTKSDEEKVASILQRITIPTLILGIDSDILYPIKEQELLAKYIPNSQFYTIHSIEGHDGFLIEQQQVGTYIQNFLSSL